MQDTPRDREAPKESFAHAAFSVVAPPSLRDCEAAVSDALSAIGVAGGAGSPPLAMHSGLMDLGLDSVDVVPLVGFLAERLPRRLPVSAVFAHATPAALACRAHPWSVKGASRARS